MLQQDYKYSATRKELKPLTPGSVIHSIRLGAQNPHMIFINRVGDKNTAPDRVTRARVADGIRHEFQYRGIRYAFTLPDKIKRGQIIRIEALAPTQ